MKTKTYISVRIPGGRETARLLAHAVTRLGRERGEPVTKGAALRAALIAYAEGKR